ncbi:hypothetical protein RJ640_014897 [Escallonia rubra]|uniref:CASP-like protein n=1 Tax=Escallonia rubra TaxID=112253 RepID=A0AA88S4U8_9ASTE|nr:hypothetical protein RJ640_014897 [Escallonia rubra]
MERDNRASVGGMEGDKDVRVANKRSLRCSDLVLRYFVVANAIACSYAAVSLLLTLASRGGKKNVALMIIILDLVMVALLFSGNGAATTAGLLGYQGNKHVQWNKVCNMFGKFCNQVAAAIAMSMLASLAFLLLVLLAALNLHKKHK